MARLGMEALRWLAVFLLWKGTSSSPWMSLKHSPALAIKRWPADLAATPTHITLSRRAVPPQPLIRRAGPIRRQSGSLMRRLHSALPVARSVAGLPLAGSGMAFGRRIPVHLVKGRGRWKTQGLPAPIGQYGVKDKGRRNMVERLRVRSRKPLRNKGLANMRQDSLRRVEGRQELRQLQLASLPATLQVDGKVTALQKMPAQYAYYGPGEQHGAYLLHRAGGKIVRVTYTADQRGFRPKFRSFSSSAELNAFLEQHSVPSALKDGNTSLHIIDGIPTIAPIQDNSLNDALPAADGGTSRLTTPIGDHSAAPTLNILSPTTPVDNDTSPPTVSSTTTTTTVPQQQGTTTTPPAEDSAANTKAPQEATASLTLPDYDTSTTLPKEPTSVTTLTPSLDNTTTTASLGDNSFTITTPLPADTIIIISPTNTANTTEASDDSAINMQLTEQDLTYQDITTSQTEAITSSEDTTIMTTSTGDSAVTAITESDTTTAAPSGSALAISEGLAGNVVITLDSDAIPNTTSASTLVPNVTSFFSGDATDNNKQTTPNDTDTFNPTEASYGITPASKGDTLDDITLTTTPDTAFTDPLSDIASLTSSEETITILDTPTPTHTTSLDDSSEHDTTTTMIFPDTTYPATSVPDDITIAPSTFDDNITVTTDNPSSPTLSTNANNSNNIDAVAITINAAATTSSSTNPSTPRDNTLSENIDASSLTDTTTMISDILVTNPVTEATIMSIDTTTTTTTETDDTTVTGNDVSPSPSLLTPNITVTSEEDEDITAPPAESF